MSHAVSKKMINTDEPIVERDEEVLRSFRVEQDERDLREIFNNAFDRDSDQQISSTEFVHTMRVSIGLKLDEYDILDLFDELLTDHHRGISLVEFRALMLKETVCKIKANPLDVAMVREALQNLFDPHQEDVVDTAGVERGMNNIGWLLRHEEIGCMYTVAGSCMIDNQIELGRFGDQLFRILTDPATGQATVDAQENVDPEDHFATGLELWKTCLRRYFWLSALCQYCTDMRSMYGQKRASREMEREKDKALLMQARCCFFEAESLARTRWDLVQVPLLIATAIIVPFRTGVRTLTTKPM